MRTLMQSEIEIIAERFRAPLRAVAPRLRYRITDIARYR
jgi:hypothetical protein